MYQSAAWIITILLSIVIILVFLFIVLNSGSRKAYENIQKRGYRIRNFYFLILLSVLIGFTFITIDDLPFERPKALAADPKPVDVTAMQFGWELSTTEFKVGEPIEFRVTSKDVNHGFGIYDKDMKLVAQTQAMPEYINKVYHTFKEPGTYKILCMEYCGLAHHLMIGEITVLPKD